MPLLWPVISGCGKKKGRNELYLCIWRRKQTYYCRAVLVCTVKEQKTYYHRAVLVCTVKEYKPNAIEQYLCVWRREKNESGAS